MLVLSRVSVFAYQMVDVTPETQVVNSCAKPFGYGHATNSELILGDPIDPATGAYSVNESWIHIYGSDPLDLRFFYNSQRLTRAEQGFGISFEAYLEETHNRPSSPRSVHIVWPGRYTSTYEKTPAQSAYFDIEAERKGDYVNKLDNGIYILTKQDQSQYIFKDFGLTTGYPARLISVKDAHGEVINISYTKPEMNIRGTVTVSDTSTRKAILLTYNKENFLVEATTDPAGRGLKVTLTYDRFGPWPSSIQLEDNLGILKRTTYAYDSMSEILRVTNMNGGLVVSNTYDSSGRVVSQENGAGKTTVTYSQTSDGNRITAALGEDGKRSLYAFDPALQLIAMVKEGNRSFHYLDSNIQADIEADVDGAGVTQVYPESITVHPKNDAPARSATAREKTAITNGVESALHFWNTDYKPWEPGKGTEPQNRKGTAQIE